MQRLTQAHFVCQQQPCWGNSLLPGTQADEDKQQLARHSMNIGMLVSISGFECHACRQAAHAQAVCSCHWLPRAAAVTSK